MTEFSILSPRPGDFEPPETTPFYYDLNIDVIIDKMAVKWGKDIVRFYRCLPRTSEVPVYRRAVYNDFKIESVYNALIRFTEDLERVKALRREKEKVMVPMQKAVWLIREIGAYCETYEALAVSLSKEELTSEGMREFLRILKEILESGGYRELREHIDTLHKKIRELRFVITYDKDRMRVEPGTLEGEGAYVTEFSKMTGSEVKRLLNPFRTESMLSEIETACLRVITRKDPELFEDILNTARENENYEQEVLSRFEREVLFYLAFRTLQKDMEKEGFSFSTPSMEEGRCMEGKGLYDLALAIASLSTGRAVVSNDFRYEDGDKFFVLTGPNQGGKTTFARSLGQLVYFTQMGLDVPAGEANVFFFPDIQTHFSVEESVETGRGKLKEELTRLAPMMDENKKSTFVVINELFTTAANYDAGIMGKEVLKHFIGLDCMGIYVTHIAELSEGGAGIVSLRAVTDSVNEPTFKIERGDADDSACAEKVVMKYGLTYERLKERL